jgi:heme exporter protein C
MANIFFKILNPHYFKKISSYLKPYLFIVTVTAFSYGLYLSLIASPADYQQGEMVRIMYIHVPSAWLSLMIFTLMGLASLSCLIFRASFGLYISLAAAPIGACFALITLLTGMIWGKPVWGAWWVWDARLTSMLILFLFYICYIVVARGSSDIRRIEKPTCAIAILGTINVPIVKFSVDLWYSLHQPASLIRMGGSAIDPSMLKPLLIMFIANFCLFVLLLIFRIESLLMSFNKTS